MTIHDLFIVLQYPFVIRALIAGLALSIATSLLGTFLVLKRYALIGDGLAHVSFFAVAMSLLFVDTGVILSMIILILASLFIMKLNESGRVYADAAIGLIGAFSIALGTILVRYVRNTFVNLENYLFGSILLVRQEDLYLVLFIAIVVALWVGFYYKSLFAMTYEEDFARVNRVPTKWLNYSLAILTALTIYVGIRVVGTLLISSLIIFPTVIAMQFNQSFKGTLLSALAVSITNLLGGFLLSILFDWPTGSTIVVFHGVVFFLVYIVKLIQTKVVHHR
jgi:ABC-type Mn2+/Zn2+ transport system permease subunit